MKHAMHTPRVISEVLTKWNVQLMYILAAIVFLSLVRFEF
jgi:hypothetical protein